MGAARATSVSLSRIGAASHGNASTICCASHSTVGYRVTANQSSCHRPWPTTRKAIGTRTSGLEPRRDRSPRWRPHGCAEMSAKSAMAALGAGSCIGSSSIAIGMISSTSIAALSPGVIVSVPAGSVTNQIYCGPLCPCASEFFILSQSGEHPER
jgi:hypothetical protein